MGGGPRAYPKERITVIITEHVPTRAGAKGHVKFTTQSRTFDRSGGLLKTKSAEKFRLMDGGHHLTRNNYRDRGTIFHDDGKWDQSNRSERL